MTDESSSRSDTTRASGRETIERQPAVERELARLLDVHGITILEESGQIRRALQKAAPEAARPIGLLLVALSAGVGDRLRAVEDGDERLQSALKTCVEEMTRQGVGFAEAWWAVRTWAHAFALPTFDEPEGAARRTSPADGARSGASSIDAAVAVASSPDSARATVPPLDVPQAVTPPVDIRRDPLPPATTWAAPASVATPSAPEATWVRPPPPTTVPRQPPIDTPRSTPPQGQPPAPPAVRADDPTGRTPAVVPTWAGEVFHRQIKPAATPSVAASAAATSPAARRTPPATETARPAAPAPVAPRVAAAPPPAAVEPPAAPESPVDARPRIDFAPEPLAVPAAVGRGTALERGAVPDAHVQPPADAIPVERVDPTVDTILVEPTNPMPDTIPGERAEPTPDAAAREPEGSRASPQREEPTFGTFTARGVAAPAEPPSHAGSRHREAALAIEPLFGDVDLATPTLLGVAEPTFAARSGIASAGNDLRDASVPLAAGLRPDPPDWRTPERRDGSRRWLVAALVVGLPLAVVLGMYVTRWTGSSSTIAASDRTPIEPVPTSASPAPADTPSPRDDASPSSSERANPSSPAPSGDPAAIATATPAGPSTPAGGGDATVSGASPTPPPTSPSASTTGAPALATRSTSPAPALNASARTAAPAIGRVDVPAVVEGNPFTVAVQVPNAHDVVAIERRFRETTGAWPRSASSVPIAGLQRRGDTFYVPFRAMDGPARATVEFSTVTRDGRHGPASAATIVVADAYPTALREAATAALSGASTECTPSTCGRVVGVRDIVADGRSQSRLFEVTVQMDDRQQYIFTATYHPQEGTRMRMSNGTFARTGP